MGCNGCIYEDDCEGQCNIYDEELIDYEDDPNDWSEEEEPIILSENEIKQLRKYCREIESTLNDIYEIIDNQ